jgi:hypothetical protein
MKETVSKKIKKHVCIVCSLGFNLPKKKGFESDDADSRVLMYWRLGVGYSSFFFAILAFEMGSTAWNASCVMR